MSAFAPASDPAADPGAGAGALPRPDPALAGRIAQVRARVAAALRAAGRPEGDARILAVGKTFPPAVLAAAACCGLRALGENYVQEALPKIAALAPGGKFAVPGIEWHFIGPIQSNKTRAIAEGFDWVHTVDRLHVAQRLSGQRPAGRAPLQVLLEVNLDGEDAKGGIPASGLVELGRAVARLPGLALRGLMAIPRPEADPARQRESFARLARHLAHLQAAVAGDPDTAAGALAAARIDTLSMGMSGDFESALLEGATIVRIGSAIFGSRT